MLWLYRLLLLAIVCVAAPGTVRGEWTLELFVRGERLQGTPLAWSDDAVDFLGRDGSWRTFGLDEAENYRKLSDSFRPLSQGEMRGLLIGEFGRGYEVSGAGAYLVVHPAGERNQWADRFDTLYRSFVQYFAVRGLALTPPRFPLVAIVFPTRDDFAAYAARQGVNLPENVLGFYSRVTNRILLYDLASEAGRAAASENAATIIHEATHQTAFNTGVHNRFAAPPVWTVEGLGTMFESPGVYDSRRNTTLESRVNRGRLESFRRHAAPRRTGETLAELIESDRLFRMQPDAAYAHAWALTFYLSEQQPRQYGRYLAKTASRPALSAYPAAERVQDFREHFGDDFAMLEARLLRFIASIP
jgi:hypothetical protein